MDAQPELISLEKAYEVRHWMRALSWTEGELYDAVRSVGKRFVDLRAYRATVDRPYSVHRLV